MIDRWHSNLVDVLHRRYTSNSQNIEKRHLHAAMVSLQRHRVDVSRNFVTALSNTLNSGVQISPSGEHQKHREISATTSFDDLELICENQMQDTVDSLRLLQTVTLESEADLAAFFARLSTAQGFAQVKADNNPLSPKIFSNALLVAVKSVPVDNAILSLWFTHGGALMGKQVGALYQTLNELLIEKGVEPAAYRVKTDQVSDIAEKENITRLNDPSWAESLESSAFAPLDDFPDELPTIAFPQQKVERKSSSKEVIPIDSKKMDHQDFVDTSPAVVARLSEIEKNCGVNLQGHGEALNMSPMLTTQICERFKLEAKNSGQLRAVNVMSSLIEKLVKDQRLLAPVQQVIANAEPAFLQLAISDPGFLTNKSHLAQSLMNTIVSNSLAFANESSPGFAEFMLDLQHVAVGLSDIGAGDASNFASLLAGFEKKIFQRRSIAHENYGAAALALQEKDQLRVLSKKISAEILTRSDFILGNQIISAFLTGPWSQVLAKERLVLESDKTGVCKAIFSLTLGELLWSLDGTSTISQPKQLAKLIPSVLEKLYGGLQSINAPLSDSQTFFDELLTIYLRSLNASAEPFTAAARRDVLAQNKQTEFELKSLFSGGDSSSYKTLLQTPQKARLTGSEASEGQRAEPSFQQTQPFSETVAGRKIESELPIILLGGNELKLGAWVELMEDERWLSAQLTWISLHKTLFMFTSAGNRIHSMTEPLLEYYFLQGQVKIICHEGVLAESSKPHHLQSNT